MNTRDILQQIEENNGRLTIQNDVGGWFALTRDGLHYIDFSDGTTRYYANPKSWAKRVTRLLNTGA